MIKIRKWIPRIKACYAHKQLRIWLSETILHFLSNEINNLTLQEKIWFTSKENGWMLKIRNEEKESTWQKISTRKWWKCVTDCPPHLERIRPGILSSILGTQISFLEQNLLSSFNNSSHSFFLTSCNRSLIV